MVWSDTLGSIRHHSPRQCCYLFPINPFHAHVKADGTAEIRHYFSTKFYISKLNWAPLRPTRPALVYLLFSVLISLIYYNNFFSLSLALFFQPPTLPPPSQLQLFWWVSCCYVWSLYLLQHTYWLPHVAKMCLEEGIKLLFLVVRLFGHLDTFTGMWHPRAHTEPSNWRVSIFFLHCGGPHTGFPCEPCCKEMHIAPQLY